jgi:hypothetical protein
MTTTSSDNFIYPCLAVHNLDDVTFIAGTYYELVFTTLNEYGIPIDLNGATIDWALSLFGDPTELVLQKSGIISTPTSDGIFTVILLENDTSTLGGKYIQQPVIVDSVGKTFRPGQGLVNIIKATPVI